MQRGGWREVERLAWLGLALLVVARKWGCSRKSGTERPERHAEFPRALRRPGGQCRAFPFLSHLPPETRIPRNIPGPGFGEIPHGLLHAIGQTLPRDSDKLRLVFRTEADSEGLVAGIT